MSMLPDAAKMDPEALAKRWFSYVLSGVFAIFVAATLLSHSRTSTRATSDLPTRVGEVNPQRR
jgi:hypothetical protein